MRKFNMILSGFIFVVGCGGSNSSTEFDPIKGTENPPDVEGCKSDQDCKSDRICENNVCVSPDVAEEDGGIVEDSGIKDADTKDGSIQCKPLSCKEDQCGIIENECEEKIDCGEDCDGGAYAKCGAGFISEYGVRIDINPNKCGGECRHIPELDSKCLDTDRSYYACTHQITSITTEINASCISMNFYNEKLDIYEYCCR